MFKLQKSGEKSFHLSGINCKNKIQIRLLCCLKNRQGINYDIFFKYFPANDCFIPCLKSDFKDEEPNTDSNDNNDD